MYIIIDKDNKITDITTTVGYEENGNIILDDGTQIACFREVEVREVEEIPENVVENKYCYTEEKGFYKNENYQEHYTNEERISALEDTVNMLLGF